MANTMRPDDVAEMVRQRIGALVNRRAAELAAVSAKYEGAIAELNALLTQFGQQPVAVGSVGSPDAQPVSPKPRRSPRPEPPQEVRRQPVGAARTGPTQTPPRDHLNTQALRQAVSQRGDGTGG